MVKRAGGLRSRREEEDLVVEVGGGSRSRREEDLEDLVVEIEVGGGSRSRRLEDLEALESETSEAVEELELEWMVESGV